MTKKLGIFLLFIAQLFQAYPQAKFPLPPGFPDRSANLDVLPGFKNPPKGYGEVPFYWWVGDTLTKERITWQLDQLMDHSITGLQINYCHTDKGGATYGLTYASQPALFSKKWWELFQWFLQEAKKRNMSVSLSDYTLGAAGQGWFVDEMLKENPGLNGSKLEAKQFDVPGGQAVNLDVTSAIISAYAFPVENGEIISSASINLLQGTNNFPMTWMAPAGKWKLIVVYKTTVKSSFDPMNPLSGKKVVEKFYQRFEDYNPGESGKGLNFFFSDELQFGIRGFLWNDQFAGEFKKRKGYEIMPELSHLFSILGPRSYKVRMDYNDVVVSLSEEGFFKPVYNWHNSRGMLFGCDHGGRGRDVTEFGDYFRTQRWMSGPGCDQPGLGKDIVKNKVASSITHLYERPRTWLEGFYGSGWGTSSEEIADATFANFAMGQNLLSLHGLYYSTHGSWWEWAAPENHWRQPYWKDMSSFLQCTERLSYLLSQGHHRCDVAMIYPVAPTEAGLKGKESTETAFSIARDLYPNGIDFDFMDFESLDRALIQNKELNVSGEKYKVLLLPALSAIRYSTIEKALKFYREGGIVLAVGSLPEASDRIGGKDEQLQSILRELFGTTAGEKQDTTITYSQKSKAGGTGLFIHNPKEAKKVIADLFIPDFKATPSQQVPGLLHRKIGNRDVYFVYGLPKNTSCFFRSTGKAELWNPWNGTTQPLKVSSFTENGTTLQLPLEKSDPQVIVFSPGTPLLSTSLTTGNLPADTLKIDTKWEFELKPTLDNRFGDYRIPAFNGKLGVEVWNTKFSFENATSQNWQSATLDDTQWKSASISYGEQFYCLGPIPAGILSTETEKQLAELTSINELEPVVIGGKKYTWKPYEFSWRWGLKDDAGHQGYHGMKGVVNNELLSFGKISKFSKHMPVYPLKVEQEGSVYYLWTNVLSPGSIQATINKSGVLPEKAFLNRQLLDSETASVHLNQGANPLLLKYTKVGRGYFIFKNTTVETKTVKSIPLATDWYLNPSVLPFASRQIAKYSFGWYRFSSPPGMKKIFVTAKTKPEIWLNGKSHSCKVGQLESGRIADKGLTTWVVELPAPVSASGKVAVRLEQLPGFTGGAALPEPVLFECSKGEIQTGDLDLNESLRTYSGGMWYRKNIVLDAKQATGKSVVLNLGRVVASAEVWVNGQLVGSAMTSPWKFDLTGKLKTGDNRVEVLVYNTLGNHYLTTPSQYIGRTNSGLIGPVTLEIQQ